MKRILRVLGASLFLGLLLLAALTPTVGAHTSYTSKQKFALPKSPVSPGVLVAQGIHKGTIPRPHGSGRVNVANPETNCKPTPCVLPNVQASEGGSPVNEDPIASDPLNTTHLLTGGNDYNCSSLQGFYSSSDGGTTWLTHCLDTLPGASGDGDPVVGYDLNHISYIAGIDSNTPDGSDIVFEKSTNNGFTWSTPAIAVRPTFSGGLTDKDWLQIDDGVSSPHANAIYISVTQFDSSFSFDQISVSHSYDGGMTWTTVAVDPPQSLTSSVDQFSDLAIGKDGTVYVTWLRCPPVGPTGDCGDTVSTMFMSKSTDGGNTWTSPVVAATITLVPDFCNCAFYGSLPNTNERVSDIPVIDIDNSSGSFAGHLYVVMYTWTGIFMKVQVTSSSNGGATWSTPKRVATKGDTHDQFFPWLSVSRTGVVGVTWLDRRDDPANINYEAFSTVSTDGGTTYGTNFKISTAVSNPFNDGFSGDFMGDYTGNIWAGKKLFASWMDTRNGVDCQDEVGGYKSSI